ncbi:MAG: hypothetical protein ACOVQR_13595, partial [Flavobacterium sp.]|uniref:hypothetical protein n=1 Tax=Flavobacterium sp. TaxID=239 RepID=UPI003BA795B7
KNIKNIDFILKSTQNLNGKKQKRSVFASQRLCEKPKQAKRLIKKSTTVMRFLLRRNDKAGEESS